MNTVFSRRVLVALFAASALSLAVTPVAQAAAQTEQTVGYFQVYNGVKGIDKVPWKLLTRLNVAFIGIDAADAAAWLVSDGSNALSPNNEEVEVVRALVAARNANNPQVQLLLSVGGATMSNRFSKAVATEQGRNALATSSVMAVKSLGLDGVDYDWEYPGRLGWKNCEFGKNACQSPDDFVNLTKLLQATKAVAPAGQLLTAAVYFDPTAKGVAYDVPGMDALLDSWNIMAYDIAAPSWVENTAFHAGMDDATHALDAFVRLGATPAKLVLGVPLYGYIWKNVPWAGAGATPTAAQGSKAGRQYGVAELFLRYVGQPGCKVYQVPQGDFYYCTQGPNAGEWCAVDTVRVLKEKGNFVRDNGFGGLMSWAVDMDTPSMLMARTMYSSLR